MKARYQLILAEAIITFICSGCANSSGIPRFVKYTPDGQHLILADAIYKRGYVHSVPKEDTYAFDGWFACEDDSGRKWVVVEQGSFAVRKAFQLVSADQTGHITITPLPQLPGTLRNQPIKVAFGPKEGQISLMTCPDSSSQRMFLLTIGDHQWEEIVSEQQLKTLREYIDTRTSSSITSPGNIPASSYTFATTSRTPSGHNMVGKAVRCTNLTYYKSYGFGHKSVAEYELPSPNDNSLVTITLRYLPYGRGTGKVVLTRVGSRNAYVLMEKNDMLPRIVDDFFGSGAIALLFLPVLF